MAYAKVNPSGTTERHGLIQTRLDMFLESGDVRYDDPRFYVIDQTSTAFLKGYKGKVDEFGSPLDLEAYAAWEASLPRIWLPERCFHHHFVYLDPYTLKDEDITGAIAHHLPNFYKAWTKEWDKVQGGMRHGWDVATRKPRPTRYDKTEPELYVARKAECLTKLDVLSVASFTTQVTEIGETFPATEIDVGSAASDRASARLLCYATVVDGNNAANDTGTIDSVEIWLNGSNNGKNVWVGSFSDGGSNVLTCHDSESIGAVTAGSKQAFTSLDIDINSGEYIGCSDKGATSTAQIESDVSGYDHVWVYTGGECIDPTDSRTFTSLAGDAISLYGTGDTGGWGNIAKVGGITATDLAKIDGIAVADIAKINGVSV